MRSRIPTDGARSTRGGSIRPHGVAAAVCAAGLLAACGVTDPDGADPNGTGEPSAEEPSRDHAPDDDPREDEPRDDDPREDEPRDDDPREEEPRDDEPRDDEPQGDELGDAEPLTADATTGTSEREASQVSLTLTDVRLASHDGFDRIVLEVAGEGEVGWSVRYVDEPTSQGSGQPIDVAGDAALSVALHGMLLPPDAPDEHRPWDGERLHGRDDRPVVEVVDDTIFEGIHLVVVGVADEQPYRIDRFEDPQRVVIDVLAP